MPLPTDLACWPAQAIKPGLTFFTLALIQLYNEAILPRCQGSRITVRILQRAKALGPNAFAVQRKGRYVTVGENHINATAVRRHGRGGVASGFWNFQFSRGTSRHVCHRLLPNGLTRGGIQAKDFPFSGVTA